MSKKTGSRLDRKMAQANRVSKKLHYLESDEAKATNRAIADLEVKRKSDEGKRQQTSKELADIITKIEGGEK